jgi:polyhydroxybutyrate depolymerase
MVLCVLALACSAAPGHAASVQQSIVSGGVSRTYYLYRPATAPATRAPLVIALHGGGMSPTFWESNSGWDPVADANGIVVTYPQATNTPANYIWNIGCCTPTLESRDDVQFIGDLIDRLVATAGIDPDRVYVTGFSTGAQMSYRLACDLSGKLAGIASAAGYEALDHRCAPDRPVSIFEMHGDGDKYNGACGDAQPNSNAGCTPGTGGYTPSQAQLNQEWRGLDVCPAAGITRTASGVSSAVWDNCRTGTSVRLDTIQGAGHCYPRPGSCGNFVAAQASWQFLAGHRRAAAGGTGTPGGTPTPTPTPVPGAPTTPTPVPGAPTAPGTTAPGTGLAPTKSSCVVPKLVGHTLAGAKKMLAHAHCRVGHLTVAAGRARRVRPQSKLIVLNQQPRAGTTKSAGAHVTVTIGLRPARKHARR